MISWKASDPCLLAHAVFLCAFFLVSLQKYGSVPCAVETINSLMFISC